MQKRVTTIVIALVGLVFVGVSLGLFIATNSASNKKLNDISTKLQAAQKELSVLKAEKDSNGFTPTEVVKAFYVEAKSDSSDKAKLYLGPEVQNMDIKATLKLGNDLSNITTGESFVENSGDNRKVNMTFVLPEGETTVRTFELSKYSDAWKIIGVVAE